MYEVLGKLSLNLGIVSDEVKLQFSVTKQLIKDILVQGHPCPVGMYQKDLCPPKVSSSPAFPLLHIAFYY